MKKIISVLTISALALGSVFAADVSLAYSQKGYISSNEDGTSKKLDLNGYAVSTTNDVVFSVSNDFAGVVFDFDPVLQKENDSDDDESKDVYEKADSDLASEDGVFDEYYGWVKFYGGKLKLQSGVWGDRSVNRLNEDSGEWEDNEYERYHYGVIDGHVGQDITRFAAFNGIKSLTTALTYTNGALSVTGGVITNKFKTSSDYAEENEKQTAGTVTKSGFGVDISYDIDQSTKVTAILKTPTDQSVAFAAFVDKKGFQIFKRSFDVVAGATVAGRDSDTETDFNGLEAALDLRVRYALSDKVSITSMNNFSYLGNEDGEDGDGKKNVWDMVSLAIQATDAVKLQVTGEWEYEDLSAVNNGKLSVIPGVTYSPVDGVSLTGGIIINTKGWKSPSESSIAIPFVLSVAL